MDIFRIVLIFTSLFVELGPLKHFIYYNTKTNYALAKPAVVNRTIRLTMVIIKFIYLISIKLSLFITILLNFTIKIHALEIISKSTSFKQI